MFCSLSSLVDNLLDINCEKFSNKCEYIGFKDNYLLLECSHCNAWFKNDSEDLEMHMSFVIKTLINLFCY